MVASGANLKGDDTHPLSGPQHTDAFSSHSAKSHTMKSDIRSSPLPPLVPRALLHASRFRELSVISRS